MKYRQVWGGLCAGVLMGIQLDHRPPPTVHIPFRWLARAHEAVPPDGLSHAEEKHPGATEDAPMGRLRGDGELEIERCCRTGLARPAGLAPADSRKGEPQDGILRRSTVASKDMLGHRDSVTPHVCHHLAG